jgi:hypothetical protein
MNIEEIYYNKYLKYKTKYLELKNEFDILENENNHIQTQIGGKFRSNNYKYSCDPKKDFVNICKPNNSGLYKSKESCINDCETQYIKRNLQDAKLAQETTQFNMFIKDLMGMIKPQKDKLNRQKYNQENMDIYVKGGAIIGLKVLSMLYGKYGLNKNFEEKFNEFKKLELIRDWDFASYIESTKITEAYRENLDKIANKYRLVPRAKRFILYQAKYPIKVNGEALFEIGVLESDNIVELELPLTTMKVKVNRRNLFQIFMLAKSFYSSDPIDLNVIKHIIKDMRFIIPESKLGLFIRHKLSKGKLSEQLINLIIKFSKGNINLQQFLVTHVEEPNRLLYRLLEKSIPKSIKIKTFLQKNGIYSDKITWLLDADYIIKQVEMFVRELADELYSITKNTKKNKREIITDLDAFLEGVYLERIKLAYDDIKEKGFELLRVWFGRIYTDLFQGDDEVLEIKDSQLVTIMKFMISKKLFENK